MIRRIFSNKAANITEYDIISKLIFLSIIITKFTISTCLIWIYGLFGHKYRAATLSTLHLTVLGIIIQSLKWIGHFDITKLINQKIQK